MNLLKKFTTDNLTALNFLKRTSLKHSAEAQNLFKESIFLIRKIMDLYFEYVIVNLKPVILTVTVSFLSFLIFQQRYDHVQIVNLGVYESCIVAGLVILYHTLTSFFIWTEHIKVQTYLSLVINTLGLFITYSFWFQWILTPGVNYYVKMDIVILVFILWNIIGVGLFVLFFPSPLWLKQSFIILYSSNIGFPFFYTFGTNNIWLLMLIMAIWDFFCLFIPFLKPASLKTRRGYFYSSQKIRRPELFLNFGKDVNENCKTNSMEHNRKSPIPLTSSINKSLNSNNLAVQSTKDTSFQIYSLDKILIENSIYTERIYGINPLKAIYDQCANLNKIGVHIRLFTMVFYNFLFIYSFNSYKATTSYVMLLIVALGFFMKGIFRLFYLKKFPTKVFILFVSIYITQILNYMVVPGLEKITLAGVLY